MENEELASRCHDIQVSLGVTQVPEFDLLPKVGMMVNLAIHIRGLPILKYDKLKLVADHYFGIPSMVFKEIITNLAEIEFVKIDKEGSTIKNVIPQVPFFEDIYDTVGEFAVAQNDLNEPERLALAIVSKLSGSPTERSNIYGLGAEKKNVDRNLSIGLEGGYILPKRARGKDILISPLFFSENSDVYADLTAKAGASRVQRILELVKHAQGVPLSVIERDLKIGNNPITIDDVNLLKTLAQDGAVKPPSITTEHSGSNYFIFTPAPGGSKLNPSNREIYERAMALISSVRQGQFLAKNFPILFPIKILEALKRNGSLKSTTETYAQYHQLALMKVGRLSQVSGSYYKFSMIETEENSRALDLAINMLETGDISKMGVNEDARIALENDQTYIESIVSSSKLRQMKKVTLDEETEAELENILLKGSSND